MNISWSASLTHHSSWNENRVNFNIPSDSARWDQYLGGQSQLHSYQRSPDDQQQGLWWCSTGGTPNANNDVSLFGVEFFWCKNQKGVEKQRKLKGLTTVGWFICDGMKSDFPRLVFVMLNSSCESLIDSASMGLDFKVSFVASQLCQKRRVVETWNIGRMLLWKLELISGLCPRGLEVGKCQRQCWNWCKF